MDEGKTDIPKVTLSNTKKEMLEVYRQMKKILEEKASQELRPEKVKEEKRKKETIAVVDKLTEKSIVNRIEAMKAAIADELTEIAIKVDTQAAEYVKIKEAIAAKEEEIKELFEIEKIGSTLAALLEANKKKRLEFEEEMERRRQEFEEEMENSKAVWNKVKADHIAAAKEEKEEENKRRKREKEEFLYSFNREKEQKLNELHDELAKLEKELSDKKEEHDLQAIAKEKELQDRETTLGRQEKELADLQAKVDSFPKELDDAVQKMVAEITERLTSEAAKNEELLLQTSTGEKNVLSARIDALEQIVSQQEKQVRSLSSQLENAYGKVQDIAVKAVVSGHEQRRQEIIARATEDEK